MIAAQPGAAVLAEHDLLVLAAAVEDHRRESYGRGSANRRARWPTSWTDRIRRRRWPLASSTEPYRDSQSPTCMPTGRRLPAAGNLAKVRSRGEVTKFGSRGRPARGRGGVALVLAVVGVGGSAPRGDAAETTVPSSVDRRRRRGGPAPGPRRRRPAGRRGDPDRPHDGCRDVRGRRVDVDGGDGGQCRRRLLHDPLDDRHGRRSRRRRDSPATGSTPSSPGPSSSRSRPPGRRSRKRPR